MPWLETQRPKTDEDESLVDSGELAVLRDVLHQRTGSHDANTTPVGTVLDALDVDNWFEDPDLVRALKPIVTKLGARYIYHEKKRAKAFCPVANFHIRNGAIFERINWLADVTKKVRAWSPQLWARRSVCHTESVCCCLYSGTGAERGADGQLQVRLGAGGGQQRELPAAQRDPNRSTATAGAPVQELVRRAWSNDAVDRTSIRITCRCIMRSCRLKTRADEAKNSCWCRCGSHLASESPQQRREDSSKRLQQTNRRRGGGATQWCLPRTRSTRAARRSWRSTRTGASPCRHKWFGASLTFLSSAGAEPSTCGNYARCWKVRGSIVA